MSSKDDKAEAYAAAIGAGLVMIAFLVAFSIYLFPWAIPFIWDLPRGTTPAYYGILMAIEMAPVVYKWKQAVSDYEK